MDKQTSFKILMLEDLADDADLALHELKKAGLSIDLERVETKEAYEKALETSAPDVILSDFSLPQFTGLEAFTLMQAKGLKIPFLLVTGALPESAVIEIIKTGIDDYILKGNLQRLPSSLQNAYNKRSAEKRSEQLNELRKKFVGIMSHQLRTPLTVVRWHLEHLLSGEAGAVKPTQEGILREAYEANQKLVTRIDDLLTVIQIEEGRLTVNKQRTSITSLLKSVMLAVKKDCKVKNISCDYKAPENALYAIADADKMRVVFEKLIENAITYTPEKKSIHVSLAASDGKIRFEVADTGVGIPQSEQNDIFTAFFRASNAPAMLPDASGVGLAITKHFVQQHRGAIGFTSSEGKGSTFWFEIPLS